MRGARHKRTERATCAFSYRIIKSGCRQRLKTDIVSDMVSEQLYMCTSLRRFSEVRAVLRDFAWNFGHCGGAGAGAIPADAAEMLPREHSHAI